MPRLAEMRRCCAAAPLVCPACPASRPAVASCPPQRRKLMQCWFYMGVSEIRGTLFWGPYNKAPTIQGTILGFPIFGNFHFGQPPIEARPNTQVIPFSAAPYKTPHLPAAPTISQEGCISSHSYINQNSEILRPHEDSSRLKASGMYRDVVQNTAYSDPAETLQLQARSF